MCRVLEVTRGPPSSARFWRVWVWGWRLAGRRRLTGASSNNSIGSEQSPGRRALSDSCPALTSQRAQAMHPRPQCTLASKPQCTLAARGHLAAARPQRPPPQRLSPPPRAQVLRLYLAAPSEDEFLKRAEGHLMRNAPLLRAQLEEEGDAAAQAAGPNPAEGEEAGGGEAAGGAGAAAAAAEAPAAGAGAAQAGGPGESAAAKSAAESLALEQARSKAQSTAAESLPVEDADAGPSGAHVQAADNPQQAAAAAAGGGSGGGGGGPESGDAGPAGEHGGGGRGKGVEQGERVAAEDDEDADEQAPADAANL